MQKLTKNLMCGTNQDLLLKIDQISRIYSHTLDICLIQIFGSRANLNHNNDQTDFFSITATFLRCDFSYRIEKLMFPGSKGMFFN